MLANDSVLNSSVKNRGFALLDTVFKQNGWHTVKNEMNWISYTKFGDETTYFDIKLTANSVIVSVPIKNSIYQFSTSFNNYYDASEYVEQKFREYMGLDKFI